MTPIAETAGQLLGDGHAFVLATIVGLHGSTPRTAGTRMIVTEGGRTVGTIGGGLLEARIVETAKEVLSSKIPTLVHADMTHSDPAAAEMICGGRLDVLLEIVEPGKPAAAVYTAWREAAGAPEPGLLVTAVRLAAGTVERVSHGLLQGRRMRCGDLDLDPAALETLLRNHGSPPRAHTITLGNALILVEPILPAETVYVFGAGHVAQPTAHLAHMVGFRVCVIDDRPVFANPARFPEADAIRLVENFDAALQGLVIDRSGYVVIITRGHLHDRTVLEQALRTQAGYIGMIGSRRKREQIFSAVLQEGFSESDLKRVHSPIGVDIGAESCEEIAVSIVAELVQARGTEAQRVNPESTSAIVLSAGASERMGDFKPLMTLGGMTLLARAVRLFQSAGVRRIHVVVGHRASDTIPVAEQMGVRTVVNARYQDGMYASVQAGVADLDEATESFFTLPVDIPLVRTATVNELLRATPAGGWAICYPTFQGRRGHPPLIGCRHIRAILDFAGDGGLAALLKGMEQHAREVPVTDEFIHADMDTPGDYRRLAGRLEDQPLG